MNNIRLIQICVLLLLDSFTSVSASELDVYLGTDIIDFAEGYDKRLRYAPKTVVIYNDEKISLTGALNIGELLERVTGVHITRKFYGISADKFVRGNGGNWLILQNGVEIERLLPELFAIPVADIERLEVLKGSHFAVYGPSAIVGTINIVTFGPGEDKTTISGRAGTLDTRELWARKSETLDKFGYSAFIYHSGTQGTSQIIDRDRQSAVDDELGTSASFAPSAGHFDREHTDVRLSFELGEEWTVHQYFAKRNSGVGTGIVQSLDPSGRENLSRSSTNVRYSKKLRNAAVDAQLTYNIEQAAFKDLFLLPPGTLGGLFPDGVIQSYGQTGKELTLDVIARFGKSGHALEIGIGGRSGRVENDFDRRNYVIQNGSPVPFPAGPVQDYFDDEAIFDNEVNNSAFYLLLRDQKRITSDLKLDLGLRVDTSTTYGTVLNPRIGLEWSAGQYTDVYFLYGESSILPTVIQRSSNGYFGPLGNKDLEPAKIRMLEIAGVHNFSNKSALLVNTYIYEQTDDIGTVDDEDSPIGTRFENINDDSAGHGVEIVANHELTEHLNISAGVALHKNQSSGNSDSIAPSVLPSFEATYSSTQGWQGNLSVFGVGGRDRVDGDVRRDIEDYVISNIAIRSARILRNTTLSLDVQNIFDVDAREDVAEEIENDVPVWPRRVLLGFETSF